MSAIDAIELNIKNARSNIDFGQALERLVLNQDFQRVIITGYIDREAVRLVHLKGSPDRQTPEHQAAILHAMDGIGSFLNYLNMVATNTEQARKSLASDEETLTELHAEAL